MAYVQRTVTAGKTIEITKYFAINYGRDTSNRGVRKEETPEQMKKVNQKHAEDKLRWLINTNFDENDIHLVVTYKKELRPDIETALKQRRNMLRRFKRVYEKQGLIFKYIVVTEYVNKAIHHHLVINHIDVALLQEKWSYGKLRPTYLDNSGDYGKLANYLIKETSKTFMDDESPIKKRWSASRNLKKPQINKKQIKANKWHEIPKAKTGYYLDVDSVYNGVHEFTGQPIQRYTLRRIE